MCHYNILDIQEIIWGLTIAGIKVNSKQLAQTIYDISLLSGTVTEIDLTTLKNHEFITFMLKPEMLGSRTYAAQLKCIQIIKHGIKDIELRKRLHDNLAKAKPRPKISLKLRSNTLSEMNALPTGIQNSMVFDIDEIQNTTCCDRLQFYFSQSFRVQLFVWFILWWLCGTLVYVFVDQWTVFQGLYYSIQAGFSIGFGSLSEEKEYGVNTFEYCIASTSLGFNGAVTNATTLFQQVTDQLQLQTQATTTATATATATDTATDTVTSTATAKQHMLCAYQYTVNPNTAGSMLYTVVHIFIGAILIGGILSYFSASSIEASEKWYDEEEDEETLKKAQEKYDNQSSCVERMLLQWEYLKIWIGNHPSSAGAWSLLAVWLCFGAVMYEWLEDGGLKNASFIKGFYFSTAAASTGGLAGPSPKNTSSVIFSCIFCLVGVPCKCNLFSLKPLTLAGIEHVLTFSFSSLILFINFEICCHSTFIVTF